MTTYNTGNSVGSADPRDLYDNAQVIDDYANSAGDTTSDRLGVSRRTLAGMENEFGADQAERIQRFNTFIRASGYEFLGDYAAGIEVTEYNQIIRDTAGEFWRASGTTELPYTTDGTGMPEGGAFRPVGDAALRQELDGALGSGLGGLLVRGSVIYVDTIADLQALPVGELVEGQVADVSGSTFKRKGGEWHPVGRVTLKACGAAEDGVTPDDDALELALSYGYAKTTPGKSYLFTKTQTAINIDVEFYDSAINISIPDNGYFILASGSGDFFRVNGGKFTFPSASGEGAYRLFNVNVNQVLDVSIEDVDHSLGRTFIQMNNVTSPVKIKVKNNIWQSSSIAYNSASSLLIAIGDLEGASSPYDISGVEVSFNKLLLHGPTSSNFDSVKISGATAGVRFFGNDLLCKNPSDCEMEIDTYTGASESSLYDNIFRDVRIKQQEFEQELSSDSLIATSIRNNKIFLSTEFKSFWAILRKGSQFEMIGNQIHRAWPSGVADKSFRGLWLQETTNESPEGGFYARRGVVSGNIIECDYSSRTGGDVIPIACTGFPRHVVVSGNMIYGGNRLFAPNALADSSRASGNVWKRSFDSVQSDPINAEDVDVVEIAGGYCIKRGDGTIECSKKQEGISNNFSLINVDFEQPFLEFYYADGINDGGAGSETRTDSVEIRSSSLGDTNTSVISYNLMSGAGRLVDTAYSFYFRAVGRWR